MSEFEIAYGRLPDVDYEEEYRRFVARTFPSWGVWGGWGGLMHGLKGLG